MLLRDLQQNIFYFHVASLGQRMELFKTHVNILLGAVTSEPAAYLLK